MMLCYMHLWHSVFYFPDGRYHEEASPYPGNAYGGQNSPGQYNEGGYQPDGWVDTVGHCVGQML